MESHLQNPEFRNNPENFLPCVLLLTTDSEDPPQEEIMTEKK